MSNIFGGKDGFFREKPRVPLKSILTDALNPCPELLIHSINNTNTAYRGKIPLNKLLIHSIHRYWHIIPIDTRLIHNISIKLINMWITAFINMLYTTVDSVDNFA